MRRWRRQKQLPPESWGLTVKVVLNSKWSFVLIHLLPRSWLVVCSLWLGHILPANGNNLSESLPFFMETGSSLWEHLYVRRTVQGMVKMKRNMMRILTVGADGWEWSSSVPLVSVIIDILTEELPARNRGNSSSSQMVNEDRIWLL